MASQTITTRFKTEGAEKVAKDTDRIGKAQTRLGQASASSGRQFAAQANGLGGVVGIYAAAAANIFALTAAFTALNRAAQFETILRGTEALATSVGSSSTAVIRSIKTITNGQLSLIEAAEQANLALSAGFDVSQIEQLADVANRSSKALGRNLTDAFQRVTRGSIKLEPELLDEIGIFTRLDPAVERYAQQLGKGVNQLTQFERRQAFVNAVIEDGQKAFRDIDTSVLSTQEKFEKLVANFSDLALLVGGFIADALAPVAEFIDKSLGNRLLLLGSIGLLVFNNLRKVVQAFLTTGLQSANVALSGLADRLSRNKIAAEELATSYQKVNAAFTGQGAAAGGSAADRNFASQLRAQLESGGLSLEQAERARQRIPQLIKNEEEFQKRVTAETAAGRREQDAAARSIERSQNRAAALEDTMKVVKAQTQGASAASRGLAKGLVLAGNAAAFLGNALSKAFGIFNLFVIGFSALQFILSFFDIDLFTTIKDFFAGFGKEARQTTAGFDALATAVKKNKENFADLAANIGLTTDEIATILPQAVKLIDTIESPSLLRSATGFLFGEKAGSFFDLNAAEVASQAITKFKKDLEDLQTIAAGGRVANIRKNYLLNTFGPDVETAIDNVTQEIKKYDAVIQLSSITTGNLAEGITALSLASEKSDSIFANAVGLGVLKDTGDKLTITLGENTFAIASIVDEAVVLDEKLVSVAADSADAAVKLRELNRDLRNGTTSAEQASKEIGILSKLLQGALEVATKAGDPEAIKAIRDFLEDSVAPAQELVRELVNINAFSERLAKLYSGQTAIVDDAIVKGLIDSTGKLVTNEREQVLAQAEQARLIRERAENLKVIVAYGGQIGETGERVLELEKQLIKLAKTRQFALVFELEKTSKEREKALKQSERNLEIAQKELDVAEAKLVREKELNRVKVSIEQQKSEVTILQEALKLNEAQVSAVQKRVQFEKELNNLISSRADLEAKNLLQLLQIQNQRAEASDQGRVRGARNELATAEMRGISSRRELLQLQLRVTEAQTIADIKALDRREAVAALEASTQLEAIERREAALLIESQNSLDKLEADQRRILTEQALFEQQKKLADSERALRQSEIQNRITELNEQASLQKDRLELSRQTKVDELLLQKSKAELLVAQIRADEETLRGQYQYLADLRQTYTDVFGTKFTEIENPIERNLKQAESIVDSFTDQILNVNASFEKQKSLIDTNNETTIDGLNNQSAILQEQQDAANAVAEIQRALANQRLSDTETEFQNTTALIAEKLKGIDLEKQGVREKLLLDLEKAGIEKQTALEALALAQRNYDYQLSEQKRLDAAYAATKGIVMNYVENGLMELNTALIEGELTFKNIAKGFRDMLGSMLREIQSAVFRQTIAAPIAEFVGGLFAAGGRVHLAGGGSMKRDRVAAMLEPGEYVIRKEAAKKLGMSKLQELNAGVSDDPIARIIAYAYGSKVKRKQVGGPVGKELQELEAFGLGSEGVDPLSFVPYASTISRLLGFDSGIRIGKKAPPRPSTQKVAKELQDQLDEIEEVFGVQATRTKGFIQGAIDPVTGGIFGRQGAALTDFGGGVFGTRTAQGTASFTGFKAAIDANISAFNQGLFRSTPLSLAEYNAASPTARYRFNPQAASIYGGGPALTINQAAQLTDFGGYKNFSGGYTIPSGTLKTGRIGDVNLPGGNQPNINKDNFRKGAPSGGGFSIAGIDFSGDNIGLAAGGLVKMASGGMLRDRVPALLEPGEFVIRRPAAKAIGGAALGTMNATGKAPSIAVNVNNQGTPKNVAVAPPKMNGDKIILDIITRDLRNNGAIKKTLRRGK